MYDSESGRTTGYSYDLSGRLVKYREKGTDYDHSVSYTYDQENNLTQLTEKIGTATQTTGYEYDGDNRIEKVTADGGTAATADDISVVYAYDDFGRVSGQTVKYGTETVLIRQPGYDKTTGAATTDTQIDTYTVRNKNGATIASYSYTYDANGNILSVSDGTNTTTYTYDSQNQLIREDNQAAGKSWTWSYDDAGNILSKKEYAYTTGTLGNAVSTKTYTYGNSGWGDLLTAYNGTDVTYDQIGNPNSLNGRSYTWEHGRELATVSYGGTTWTNTYDANGMRTQRKSSSATYSYIYNGSQLTQMTVGSNTLYFAYDAAGTPMSVTYNGTVYYYATNLQGDITAILNTNGTAVVTYTYDAWGKLLETDGSMKTTLGVHNPLRYRGYVYDVETGLYYLQSRYYDPEIGRWINADSVIAGVGSTIQGYNMFAYCFNNPVNMYDSSGHWPQWMKDAADWANDNIIQPVVRFAKDITEDIKNYDSNNQSEEIVLESNYFSSYKGVPVVRTNGDRSGSFEVIFLTRESNNRSNPEDVLRHEYGHTKQLEQLGVIKYAICIVLPSWQQWGAGEYYSRPWEITADIFGGVQSRNHSRSDINRGLAYLDGSNKMGPFIWVFLFGCPMNG